MIGGRPRPVVGAPQARLRLGSGGGGAAFAVAVLVVASAVGLYRIDRPAYWVDEATTVMLVRWRWTDLIDAIRGPEAPLGPYYLLMKPWTSVSATEWWVRLPSALAMAGALTLAAVWVRRRLGTVSALAGVAMTLALPAYSRYAQEARPYGLMVLAVTLCVLAWWRWCERGGRAAATWYVVSVAVLPLCHTLALSLVAGQVIAALLGAAARGSGREPGCRPRLSPRGLAIRTAGLAALGLVPLLPYLWLVRRQAVGVARPLPLTWSNAWTTFTGSLAGPLRADWQTGWLGAAVVALAVVGSVGLLLPDAPQRRRVLGFLACWAMIPPVLLSLAAIGEKTLVPRYFLVSLPAWGLLAGHGCVVVARAVMAAPARGRGSPRAVVRTAAGLAGLLPLVALALAGLAHQTQYRTPSGHGNGDIRPAIAMLNTEDLRDVPVVMATQEFWWVILASAYDPDLPGRSPVAGGPVLGPDRNLSLREVDGATAGRRLRGQRTLAMLVRGDDPAAARQAPFGVPGLADADITQIAAFDGWFVVLLA